MSKELMNLQGGIQNLIFRIKINPNTPKRVFVNEILALITSHEKALLKKIEAEVIGEDDVVPPEYQYEPNGHMRIAVNYGNQLRAQQRKALADVRTILDKEKIC